MSGGMYLAAAGALVQQMRLAVLSNKPDHFMLPLIEKYFSPESFDKIQGQIKSVPLKPDPTAALALADELREHPTQIVYLGDTGTDMQTATRAGMFAVGVTWGFREADELLDAGADHVIDKPLELLEVLESWNVQRNG